MADVTIRQGIEALFREELPESVVVVDSTDHSKGDNPYFKTKKSA